jgi:hypothetical protein
VNKEVHAFAASFVNKEVHAFAAYKRLAYMPSISHCPHGPVHHTTNKNKDTFPI